MSILSTNQKLISLGQDYSAGENIGIYDHTISSRNWTPDITYAAESAFQRANEYTNTQISALSGEVSSEVSQLGSDIEALSGDVAYISGVALTSHQSLEGYLTKASGDEYYQPIGSYATVSQLESTSGEIVNLIPTDYVSNETLEQTSGNIVNLIPDTSEFITNASAEQTYQPIGNYLSSNALEGYATQDWVSEQGYLTSVSIPESATWQDVSTTVQTNSAQWSEGGTGGDEEVNEFVYNNSATINEVNTSYQSNSGEFLTAAPADMATTGDIAELAQTVSETFQVKGDYLVRSDSANFYPANNPSSFAKEDWVTAQGYITGVDLSNYYTKDETSGKEELANAFANVPAPDYEVESYIHNNSATIDESTDLVQSNSSTWNDVAVYQSNSSNYITAHQSLDDYAKSSALNDYQTIEGMTAYQPAGSYATTNELEQVSADITATIPSTAGLASESYVQTNSAVLTAMIDGKQDSLTFGYDEQDRISAINNSAIAAGDEFPASANEAITAYQTNSGDYLKESELGYNAVDEVSAINGSAISQYGAEKQWLVHDDTLVHASNSAQYALGCNISALQRLMGIDETVLYSAAGSNETTFTLNETPMNFNEIKVYTRATNWGESTGNRGGNNYFFPIEQFKLNRIGMLGQMMGGTSTGNQYFVGAYYSGTSSTTWTKYLGYAKGMNTTANADWNNSGHMAIYKVIGIGRISG